MSRFVAVKAISLVVIVSESLGTTRSPPRAFSWSTRVCRNAVGKSSELVGTDVTTRVRVFLPSNSGENS